MSDGSSCLSGCREADAFHFICPGDSDSGREKTEIVIKGRHDPVIVPRAVVVVECMAALTVAHLLLDGQGSRRLSDVKAYMETVRERQGLSEMIG